MEENVSPWKANLQNGLILGLVGIVYKLVTYFFDLYLNPTVQLLLLLILGIFLFFLIKTYRDNFLHGYITYGQSLGAGVVIYLYYSVFIAIFTYILIKFIDPGLINKQLALAEEMMSKRYTQEQIDAGMAMQRKLTAPEFQALFSIVRTMFSGTIIALIVSIFTRKEGNPLVDAPTNSTL